MKPRPIFMSFMLAPIFGYNTSLYIQEFCARNLVHIWVTSYRDPTVGQSSAWEHQQFGIHHHVWYNLASITNLTHLKSRMRSLKFSKHNIHINDHHWIFSTLCLNSMHTYFIYYDVHVYIYGGFLKWWYPTTIGFPTKNDHFGVFWGYHHLRETPIYI